MEHEKQLDFAKGKEEVPLCSICRIPTRQRDEKDPDEFTCPKCFRSYIRGREILEYSDTLGFRSKRDDELPEIYGTGGSGPGLTMEKRNSALAEIYDQDREEIGMNSIERKLRYKPMPGETITYEDIYIPDVDHTGE